MTLVTIQIDALSEPLVSRKISENDYTGLAEAGVMGIGIRVSMTLHQNRSRSRFRLSLIRRPISYCS